MANVNPVVIDNGTGIIKAGFGGEGAPKTVFSSILGYPRFTTCMPGPQHKPYYLGDDGQYNRGIASIKYPIKDGIIQNFDDMQIIWERIYQDLQVDPRNQPVLLTEAPHNPKGNRERMTHLMFEEFEVPEMYISLGAVLTVYSCGRNCALVLDSGSGVTHTLLVYDGYTLKHTIHRTDFAGCEVTNYLTKLLTERGNYLPTTSNREIVEKIKEKLGYVALDFDEELNKANEKEYELPDGRIVKIGSERFRCAEALFRPELAGSQTMGIHNLVYSTIMKSDIDVRKSLYGNVVLSGGNTMFSGIAERLTKELINLAPASMRVKVIAPPERNYSVWIGGSILSSLSTFQPMWISREEYDEYGPLIVHRKCL